MPRFSDAGKDKDGNVILRQWTAEEEARRDAEEAFHEQHKNDPAPKDEITRLKDRVTALEEARGRP